MDSKKWPSFIVKRVVLVLGYRAAPATGTQIKKKRKFSSYVRKFRGIRCKVIYDYDFLIYGDNICAFPQILGTPSSYMTLHPIPPEFTYI